MVTSSIGRSTRRCSARLGRNVEIDKQAILDRLKNGLGIQTDNKTIRVCRPRPSPKDGTLTWWGGLSGLIKY